MGLEKQGSHPTGWEGRLMGKLMNCFHTKLYVKYFGKRLPPNKSTILDLGCGGGKFIQYLEKQNRGYHLIGVDHSQEMVELSIRVNKTAIESRQVEIFQGQIDKLPMEDQSINLATAMETIQFWPNPVKAFAEVYRTLQPGGEFIIINRYPPEGSKWWNLARIKSEEEYHNKLKLAGFSSIHTDINFKQGWIVAKATK